VDATGAELVERYGARWEVEQASLDSKHRFGIADARIRRQRSVERVVPFTLAATSLAIIWYARHGQPAQDLAAHRARAPGTPPSRPSRSPTCSPRPAAHS
jgi:hypothetical protein